MFKLKITLIFCTVLFTPMVMATSLLLMEEKVAQSFYLGQTSWVSGIGSVFHLLLGLRPSTLSHCYIRLLFYFSLKVCHNNHASSEQEG